MKISFLASRATKAQAALDVFRSRFGHHQDAATADVVVALGGDGFMLEVLHGLENRTVPVYGMNRGSVGFLMNSFAEDDLIGRLERAALQPIHPLALKTWDLDGVLHQAWAINDVSILRGGPQAANLRVLVNGSEQIENLVCDGAIVATPAGSTAYNSSAHGPILPIGSNVLALTPLAVFRPRRWRGAVLPDQAKITFEALDPDKRPVMVNADSLSFPRMLRAEITLDRSRTFKMLFDPGHGLEDRILSEQFV